MTEMRTYAVHEWGKKGEEPKATLGTVSHTEGHPLWNARGYDGAELGQFPSRKLAEQRVAHYVLGLRARKRMT